MYCAKNNRGFTIVEILVALAITGIMLAAVAVAFNASAENYLQNEYLFSGTSNSRQAMSRMITDIRTAAGIETNEPNYQCSMFTAAGDDITYCYDSTDKRLYLVTNDDVNDANYVLCDNVSATTFTRQTGVDDDGVFVKGVQISITVEEGDRPMTVSAATVPRRNSGRGVE